METKKTKSELFTLLTLGSVVVLFLMYLTDNASFFWLELWFLLEVLIITTFTRTTNLIQGLRVYCLGAFISFGLILLLNLVFKITGTADSTIRNVAIATGEEFFKLLPVILVAIFIFKRKDKILLNLSDYLFLGAFSGSGFSMLEKYLWGDVYFPFTYGPHVGDFYLFSDALGITVSGEPFGYVGHAAATAFVAMGLGLGLYLKNTRKKFELWWAIPAACFAWITIEHILYNAYYDSGSEILLYLGGGQLTPWLCLAMLGVGLFIDFSNLVPEVKDKKVKKGIVANLKKIKDIKSFFRFFRLIRFTNLHILYRKFHGH